MYLVLVGELFEPFAERLVGIGHDYERRRVDLFDLMLHEVHLLAAHDQEDHVPRSVRIHPLRLDVGRTAVEVFDDEAFERLLAPRKHDTKTEKWSPNLVKWRSFQNT